MAKYKVMRPRDLHYAQSSIIEDFVDGETLTKTFGDLLYGNTHIEDIPEMEVMFYDDRYWVVAGNRRLLLYKQLEAIGRQRRVKVILEPFDENKFFQKMTTRNGGTSVRIRSDRQYPEGRQLLDRLERIVMRWEKKGRPYYG